MSGRVEIVDFHKLQDFYIVIMSSENDREHFYEHFTRDSSSIRVLVINGDRHVQITEDKAVQTDPYMFVSLSSSSDELEYNFTSSPTYHSNGQTICWHTP